MVRHEGYFDDIWKKLDRLPRWASVAGAVMGTVIGALASTVVHMMLARGA